MVDVVQSLLVKEPSGAERFVALNREPVTIGREPTCTIRLDSPYVSRQHARIEVDDSGLVLVDLGSRNGSLLNGDRVEGSTRLTAGDVITIANTTIQCLAEAAMDGTTRTFIPSQLPPPPADVLVVDGQARTVLMGETAPERRLSAQEFDLLRYLFDHRDRVCTRQELGDGIWGAGNWDPNMLHRLVHRLKEKLEPNPDKPRYLQTVPWVGYRVTP